MSGRLNKGARRKRRGVSMYGGASDAASWCDAKNHSREVRSERGCVRLD